MSPALSRLAWGLVTAVPLTARGNPGRCGAGRVCGHAPWNPHGRKRRNRRGTRLSEWLRRAAGTAAGRVQMSERIFPAASYEFASVRKSENILPPKETPRRGAPGVVYLQYRMRKSGGPAPGKVWAGEAPEGPAFPRRLRRAGRGQLAGWMQMSERIFPAAGYGFTSVCKSENIPSTKRNSPARTPDRLHLQYRMRKSGACAGEGLAGGGPRGTGLSLRGGALQGLLQRWESYQAGPSKVFSNGSNLHKRGSEGPGEKILQGFAGNPANSG